MNIFLKFLFFAVIALITSQTCYSQNEEDICNDIQSIAKIIEENHYKPKDIDSIFSVTALSILIDNLDPEKLYFTREDSIIIFSDHSLLYQEIISKDCSRLKLIYDLYDRKISEFLLAVDQLEFDAQQYEIFNGPKGVYPQNKDTYLNHLSEYFYTETYLYDLFGVWGESNSETSGAIFDKLLNEAKCKAQNIKENLKTGGFKSLILRSFVAAYDPHTIYFTSRELQQFNHDLSKKDFSFGIEIKEVNGQVSISRVVPGGPAWRSNQIHEEDIILGITDKEDQPFSISCSIYEEISEILNSPEIFTINLIVGKRSGRSDTVHLLKDVIDVEENVINGYILNGRKKVGYISLPAFYGDKFSENSPGCAHDVAKEIVKLKRQNIEALIFDLRFNTGGRLEEAVELAGIFLNYGPVCVAEYNDKAPFLLKDQNRGAIYSGPMVVLVNNFSASASEIFAAALQDYNRALIVGERTFGKSTGQRFFPVKGSDTKNDDVSILNLTTLKLYRVAGSTYQQKGVTPDISLPDLYNLDDQMEDSYANAIDTLGTSKKIYYTSHAALPVKKLREQSEERLSQNAVFKNIALLNSSIGALISGSGDFTRAEAMKIKDQYSSYRESRSEIAKAYVVENNFYNDQVLQISDEKRLIDAEYTDKVQSDIYIQEAYFILSDFLEIKQNN